MCRRNSTLETSSDGHVHEGEDRYRLLTNNCEHFCEWCLQGERRRYQIEACLELPSRALLATERLVISIGECVSAFGKGVLVDCGDAAIRRSIEKLGAKTMR